MLMDLHKHETSRHHPNVAINTVLVLNLTGQRGKKYRYLCIICNKPELDSLAQSNVDVGKSISNLKFKNLARLGYIES